MNVHRAVFFVLATVLPVFLTSCAGIRGGDPMLRARKAIESCDSFMGDYQGGWKLNDGTDSGPLVARVIALGKGEYRAVFFDEFDVPTEPLAAINGGLEGSNVRLTKVDPQAGTFDLKADGVIEADKLSGTFDAQSGAGTFELTKTIRLSPTLGAKPPAGAIVLFNGKNFKQWKPLEKKAGADKVQWALVKGGAMDNNVAEPGGIYLQDHGNPVQYRNIWLIEL